MQLDFSFTILGTLPVRQCNQPISGCSKIKPSRQRDLTQSSIIIVSSDQHEVTDQYKSRTTELFINKFIHTSTRKLNDYLNGKLN